MFIFLLISKIHRKRGFDIGVKIDEFLYFKFSIRKEVVMSDVEYAP